MDIVIKRTYEDVDNIDSYRVLVDRLWPRGVTKQSLQIDEWCKDVAPSNELRKWFNHDPARFEEFAARYTDELEGNDAARKLLSRVKSERLTLLYGAKDSEINHAVILRDYLKDIG